MMNRNFILRAGGRAARITQAGNGQMCDLGCVRAHRITVLAGIITAIVAVSGQSLRAQADAPDSAAATNLASAGIATTNSEATNAVTAEPATPAPEPAPQPSPPSSGKLDYNSFKIVLERNIFNGNRSGQRITSTRSSSQQRSVRVDAFTLVGTMLSAGAPVAFFDGSESDFRRPMKVGERIAGFEVRAILHAGVRLAQGTNTLDLEVGSGLRREDQGLWKYAHGGTAYAASSSSRSGNDYIATSSYSSRSSNGSSRDRSTSSRSSNGSGNSSPAASSTSEPLPAADAAEVLKRLMEKREKE